MFFYDWTMIIVIPGLLLALYAQTKISSSYHRYGQIHARSGLTAAECARDILRNGGASNVRVERVSGRLTDHYDPRDQVLLSLIHICPGKTAPAIRVAGICVSEGAGSSGPLAPARLFRHVSGRGAFHQGAASASGTGRPG